jgi:orotidine-5'-phosphate decarboxylase
MTELIVALDGTTPAMLRDRLFEGAGVKWFKVGPQAMTYWSWPGMMTFGRRYPEAKIFLDLKLADTRDTIREAVKRFADAGVAAVSTFTEEATMAACAATRDTPLKVWQVLVLSDDINADVNALPYPLADGAIVSGQCARNLECRDRDKVVPGVRFFHRKSDGHINTYHPGDLRDIGATHAVVGRPIWQASDPIAAAREFTQALNPQKGG